MCGLLTVSGEDESSQLAVVSPFSLFHYIALSTSPFFTVPQAQFHGSSDLNLFPSSPFAGNKLLVYRCSLVCSWFSHFKCTTPPPLCWKCQRSQVLEQMSFCTPYRCSKYLATHTHTSPDPQLRCRSVYVCGPKRDTLCSYRIKHLVIIMSVCMWDGGCVGNSRGPLPTGSEKGLVWPISYLLYWYSSWRKSVGNQGRGSAG